MNIHNLFVPFTSQQELPDRFPSPFSKVPHSLAIEAAKALQQRLGDGEVKIQHGQMFGVLVVENEQHQLGYLSAFAGQLNGEWQVSGFVPPVFDITGYQQVIDHGERRLMQLNSQLQERKNALEYLNAHTLFKTYQEQSAEEIVALTQTNLSRKKNRQQERANLQNHKMVEEHAEILQQLANASQNDRQALKQLKNSWQEKLATAERDLAIHEDEQKTLEIAIATLESETGRKKFDNYHLLNSFGERRKLSDLFVDKEILDGTGDCCGPKLLQYAYANHLKPVAIAEFWWGAQTDDEIRLHREFYPACRGRCLPVLDWMLMGLETAPRDWYPDFQSDDLALEVVYEDDDLVVVNKPAGLLSVPGNEKAESVLGILQQRYPEASGPLLVHRLDMYTSGLLIAAKNLKSHKALQRQFIKRLVTKRYVALLEKNSTIAITGRIELPLRVDLNDRPRQVVCNIHGKTAITDWRVIEEHTEFIRVHFFPLTGRTHQLRVHAAHKNGLNAPIVGDKLYGRPAQRMMLHAEQLSIIHPTTGECMKVEAPAPF